jgi:hypothetical protein
MFAGVEDEARQQGADNFCQTTWCRVHPSRLLLVVTATGTSDIMKQQIVLRYCNDTMQED